jgi:tetratricopeptide (TPR) repeat protein
MRLLAAVAMPLAALALIEGVLRLAGFGHPTAFLLPSENHGQKTFVQNNDFGWRFFGKRKQRVPAAISILRDKPPDVTRIFVFGESAAFGDPQPEFGLPRTLQATLSLRHPDMKFEVVNAAMTAINSHVILPIARECAKAGGDIWVVYMGNNEVVGPFGAGTVFGSQAMPLPVVRMNVALKATRLGQVVDLLRDRWQEPPTDKSEWGGMMMFLDQQVRADDPRMRSVYHSFEKNLIDIIHAGHASGAGVVVSTVAVDLRDCAPFASLHRPGFSASSAQQFDQFVRLGLQDESAGNFSAAAAQFESALQLDDTVAEIQFRLGQCLLQVHDLQRAKTALLRARDSDTLRFRCDTAFNDLTRKTATGRDQERILLADSERAFADASPDGLPGWNYFYEHVHLTFEGNYLLARTIAEQVEKLLPAGKSPAAAWPTETDCARRLGWTERDRLAALTEIISRVSDPPFATQLNHDEQVQYLTQSCRRSQAGAGLPEAAQAIAAALKISPDDATLQERMSVVEQADGHFAQAEAAGQRAVELLPSNAEFLSELGMVFVHEQKYDDALRAFQKSFQLNPQDAFPLQNIATCLSKLGRNDDAMAAYRRAIAISPRFGLAWLGLGQLLESAGQKNEAQSCYDKALRYRIHRAPELATLARFCLNRGWLEAATTNFDDAVKLSPSDPALSLEAGKAHFLYGKQLGGAGQSAAAAGQFRQATELMPDVVEARLNLGIALFKDKQWDAAGREFEQVIAGHPTNSLARHYLEILQAQTKPAQP